MQASHGNLLACLSVVLGPHDLVSKASFFESLWAVLRYIVKALQIVFKMDAASCNALAVGFRLLQCRDVFQHIIGAVVVS